MVRDLIVDLPGFNCNWSCVQKAKLVNILLLLIIIVIVVVVFIWRLYTPQCPCKDGRCFYVFLHAR